MGHTVLPILMAVLSHCVWGNVEPVPPITELCVKGDFLGPPDLDASLNQPPEAFS